MNKLTNSKIQIIMLIFAVIHTVGFLAPLSADAISAQEKEQEHGKIVEEVTVTNVEVPVRVIFKGQPVTDLKVEDFKLYENRKKMKINGFFLKRKAIDLDTSTGTQVSGEVVQSEGNKPRTFVLVFNVVNYNKYFQEAMDHLFDNFLRASDRVMVFANNTTREYPDLSNKSGVKAQVVSDLKKESDLANRRLLNYIKQVENVLNNHAFHKLNFTELGGNNFRLPSSNSNNPADLISGFLDQYLRIWRQYKKVFLTPKLDTFYYFSRYLEKVKTDKWVLNFYQFEVFPRIRLNSRTLNKLRDFVQLLRQSEDATDVGQSRVIDQLLQQVAFEFDFSKSFPNEEVSKLFYKVDATFHSFFIRSSNTAFLQDIEYRQVSSDLEQLLKRITDITGGDNITSNNLVESLQTVSKREDAYYMLTYAPKNPKRAGKIQVKVKSRKYKVYYDDNFRADYINAHINKLEKDLKQQQAVQAKQQVQTTQQVQTPDVKIEGFSFKNKILAFAVRDFLMRNIEGKTFGQMEVRIRLNQGGQSLFDQKKMLRAQKDVMTISLPMFKNIPKGTYDFMIGVKDMMTGKEANISENVVVKR